MPHGSLSDSESFEDFLILFQLSSLPFVYAFDPFRYLGLHDYR